MATSTTRMPLDERRHHRPSCIDHVHFHTNNSLSKTSVETYVPLITVHSLSLMQTWLESEAEARLCPTPHTSMAVTPPAATTEEPSFRLEEPEFFEMEITGNVPAAALFPSPALPPSPSLTAYTGNALTVTGRQDIEDFLLKLEEEHRREVAALGELHLVSRFPFRGRIQVYCHPERKISREVDEVLMLHRMKEAHGEYSSLAKAFILSYAANIASASMGRIKSVCSQAIWSF